SEASMAGRGGDEDAFFAANAGVTANAGTASNEAQKPMRQRLRELGFMESLLERISPASVPHHRQRGGKHVPPRALARPSAQAVCGCPASWLMWSSLGLWASRPNTMTSDAETIVAMIALMSPRYPLMSCRTRRSVQP